MHLREKLKILKHVSALSKFVRFFLNKMEDERCQLLESVFPNILIGCVCIFNLVYLLNLSNIIISTPENARLFEHFSNTILTCFAGFFPIFIEFFAFHSISFYYCTLF